VPELEVRKLEMSMAGPLGVLAAGPAAVTTKVEDVDGGPPGGVGGKVRQRPPPNSGGPAAATTDVEDVDGGPPRGCCRQGPTAATTEVDDVDGRPPRGCCRKVWQRPPPMLRMSMAGPREVSELEIRERNAFGARPLGRAVNGCKNLGQMLKK
jgi:hypothetical protein